MSNGDVHTSAAGRVRLTTLGQAAFQIETPQEIRPVFGPGKPVALAAYLAGCPERSATRDHLVDLLWSDRPVIQAKHALSQTIWHMRQKLGDSVLVADNTRVRLSKAVECDLDLFLQCVAENDLRGIVDAYTGDFLPDFAAPGGVELEHWADLERMRVRGVFIRAAEELVRSAPPHEAKKVIDVAQRVRDSEPSREDGWRLVIHAYLTADDKLGASLEAESFRARFEEEGRHPTHTMLELLADLSGQSQVTVRTHSTELVSELVGRQHEFSDILAAWRKARGGSFVHVHITAPAGLGKTRLIDDVSRRLGIDGGKVVSTGGNRGSRSLPYTLACELAAGLCDLPGAAGVTPDSAGSLRAMHPALSSRFATPQDRAVGDEALRRRTLALTDLVQAVCHEQDVAIFIDDLHWGDRYSLRLLAGMLGQLRSTSVLVVTASRPTSDLKLEIEANSTLELTPLSPEDIGSLIASIGRVPDGVPISDFTEQLRNATGGSPLLVLETLHLALQQGALDLEGDCWAVCDRTKLESIIGSGTAVTARIQSLSPTQRETALILAVAGTPLRESMLSAVTKTLEDKVLADLSELEQQGFATRSTRGWTLVHDEIAERIIDLAEGDEIRETHLGIGRTLATTANGDTDATIRAGQHLWSAGAKTDLVTLFGQFVSRSRRVGDRRPLNALAQELVGNGTQPEDLQFLKSGVPLTVRLGLYSRYRLAFATVGVLLGMGFTGTIMIGSSPPQPDRVLYVRSPDGAGLTRTDLFDNDLSELSHVRLSTKVLDWTRDVGYGFVVSPGGNRIAYFDDTGSDDASSGGIEVFVTGIDGRERRITHSAKDDIPVAWSPDGRWLIIQTARWNDQGRYNLAAVNLETLGVHEITRTSGSDGSVAWNQNGTMIAFTRKFLDGRPAQVCNSTFDGRVSSCVAPAGKGVAVLAWLSDNTVLAILESESGELMLSEVNLRSGETESLRAIGSYIARSDGSWLVAGCEGQLSLMYSLCASPVADGTPQLPLLFGNTPLTSAEISFGNAAGRYMETLSVIKPGVAVPIGVPIRLWTEARSAEGDLIEADNLVWSVDDTSVAVIDSVGVILAKRSGVASVSVSAGGWRRATELVQVGEASSNELLLEQWRDGLAQRWIPYGEPKPAVIRNEELGDAFLNNGDGHFKSGIYSRELFRAAFGLGITAIVKTPITRLQWQSVRLSLTSDLDENALQTWGHADGRLPDHRAFRNSCSASYPGGDGVQGREYLQWDTPGGNDPVPVPANMRAGVAHSITIQIFPDGTCGLALDGVALRRSETRLDLDELFRIVISGRSDQTEILVGETSLWEGVATEVDWGR